MVERPDISLLEPFLPVWGLPTSQARAIKRATSPMDEIQSFYDTMLPRLEAVISYLDQFPLADLPADDLPLANAALAMCEVDWAVNNWKAPNLELAMNVADMPEKDSLYDRHVA